MARIPKQKTAKPRVAMVGDGETEKIYFSDMKDTDRPGDIDFFPELPMKTGSYENVINKALSIVGYYSAVFALIDMDTVISDGKEQAYRTAKNRAEKAGIVVLEMNPCFEIWPLLHFARTSRSFINCGQVADELKRADRIPDYEKTQRFLVRARLFATYRDRIVAHAIPAARQLETNRPDGNKRYPRAEVFRFFEWYFAANRLQRLQSGDPCNLLPPKQGNL
ncbi:RloB family protein [Flavitalea sp. BT771]|uniref:RloB family protein n=1 Tax=Flavitalea sp. BT771 TaxID=3063329 RepID=UPI002949F049|nr:RloB family protein [Flavitalea sp. BT771]MDV6217850.1 RloB family protein [Flavitalea sp. BT771]